MLTTRSIALLCLLLFLACGAAPGGSGVYDVTAYGAVGDARTLCTDALQAAIDACGAAGGGEVVVPPGRYLTGALTLRSHVHLRIAGGATLLASQDFEQYPPVPGRWEGIERQVHASLITGHDLENVSVTGRGTLDGRGEPWWQAERASEKLRKQMGITEREPDNPPGSPLRYPRPRMVNLYRCRNVLIRDLTFRNSPSWTIHPVYCENVTVDNITIIQPYDSPNTDGINPDSCRNVRISNCSVDCGDDCVTLKSGYNEDGRRVGIPCENVTITNCTFAHGHGGVVIGSETSGDVRFVTITNCIFDGTDRAIRIKSARRRGGVVEYVRADNCLARNVRCPFSITMHYHEQDFQAEPVGEGTPRFRHFYFSDFTAWNSRVAGEVLGLPEMPIEDLVFDNIVMNQSRGGMDCRYVNGLRIDDVRIAATDAPALAVRHVQDLDIEDFAGATGQRAGAIIELENVYRGRLGRVAAPAASATTPLDIDTETCRDILVDGAPLETATTP